MKYLLLAVAILFSFPVFADDVQSQPASGLYAYETSEGMTVGAVFGMFPSDWGGDELVLASTPVADHVEIHRMQEDNGIMKMRKVHSMPLGSGKDNALSPSGYHLMLMGLTSPLQSGKEFPLTLTFKKAGKKTIMIPALSRKAPRND